MKTEKYGNVIFTFARTVCGLPLLKVGGMKNE
jgi:hypothetical protein